MMLCDHTAIDDGAVIYPHACADIITKMSHAMVTTYTVCGHVAWLMMHIYEMQQLAAETYRDEIPRIVCREYTNVDNCKE